MARWKVWAIALAVAISGTAFSGAVLPGTTTASAQETESEDRNILTKMGSMLTFYGFLRVDAVYDSDHMNDAQLPRYVLSEDDATSGSDSWTIYTRLTRLGLDLDGGEVMDGHKLTGKLEFDFYGDSEASDSRNEPRIRHAYLNLAKDEFSFLAGQTWDLFSPLFPSANPDMLNWDAGNPGDRRPQLRFGYMPGIGEDSSLLLSAALAMQGAIDSQEDGTNGGLPNGVIDGEDAGVPQVQARAAYGTEILGNSKSELGAWLAWGKEEADTALASGDDEWTATIYGIDLVLPLTDELKLRGEFWLGENADDYRGGIGQGINTTTGDEIAAMGYWAELLYAWSKTTDVFAGYSVDDPDDDDLPTTGGRDKNAVAYAGAQYRVWDPVRLGWEYLFWNTEYTGQDDGTNHRFHLWIAYHF